MKEIFIISILLLSLNCKSQDDSISLNEITINGFVVLNETGNSLIQNFGNPNSTENYFYEMKNVLGEKYVYNNGLTLYLIDEKVVSFELTCSNYNFTSNNINIGDSITSLQNIYPNSFINRGENYMGLNVHNCDCFLSINFNSQGIIQLIRYIEP